MLVQTQWEPLVPHVTINLYQEGTAADGTPTLTLVDTTQTSSLDDWAQGFRSDGDSEHELPRPDRPPTCSTSRSTTSRTTSMSTIVSMAGSDYSAAEQLSVQVLRRHAQLEPAPACAVRRHVQVPQRDRHGSHYRQVASGTNCTICIRFQRPICTAASHAARRQVRGGGGRASGLRTGQGRGQEHPHRRQLHRAGHAAVRRLGQHLHLARPGVWLPATYNANNPQNPTQSLGTNPNNGIVPGFRPRAYLALRRRSAHRAGLHQPVPAV